jgi:hypothetical protein
MSEPHQYLLLAQPCPPCPHLAPPELRWRETCDGRWHLGAWCSACGRWLQWIAQTPTALASAPPRPTARSRAPPGQGLVGDRFPRTQPQQEIEMKLSTKFSSPYLKAVDIPRRRLRVTIVEFVDEWMGSPRECKTVLYFEGTDKGLVLNKTNAATLQKAFGDDTDAMIGRVVDLVVKPGSFQGEDIDVVRIEVPAEQPPPRPGDAELNRRLDEAAPSAHPGDDDIPF